MQRVAVTYNTWMNKGDVIGYVNNTGDSDGNHLHLGIRYKDSACVVGGDFYEGYCGLSYISDFYWNNETWSFFIWQEIK